MKATETIQYEGKLLGVYLETSTADERKAHISYFIDGTEITDWSKLVTRYQRILTALADNLCEGLNVIKWSY